jgi:hypothetical protein
MRIGLRCIASRRDASAAVYQKDSSDRERCEVDRGLVRLFEEPIVSVMRALGFSSDDFLNALSAAQV